LTFVHFIELKDPVNISIYQILEDKYLLRQKLEGKYLFRQKILCTQPYCVISNNYTLTIKLPISPFNLPNTSYSIEIDDDFLRYKREDLPVPGIELGKWIINTSKGTVYKWKLLNY